MSKYYFYIAFLVLITAACGTKKNAEGTQPTMSKKDYPYIEKFHEGLRFKAKGRVEEAISSFEACLLIRQDDDAVYYALSKLELQRGDLTKSSEHIKKAAELDPSNTWYVQELAYMYFENGEFEEAVENFEKLVEIEPRNVDWLYGYAEALVRNGQEKEAIEALTKTEEQVGKHPQFALQKYNLFMQMKNPTKGEEVLEKAREEFPKDARIIATLVDHYFKTNRKEEAVVMLKELVIADPENGRAHLALADVYQQSGEMDKAYKELEAAFKSSDIDIDTKMKILINVHEQSFKIDPEVYKLVDIMVEMYPEESKAHSIHGDYLLRQEDEDTALKAYKTALSLDKSQYPIWNQVLIMEYQAGDYEDLYKDSKECLTLFPTMTTVYLLNGVSANQIKKYDEAVDVLTLGKELILSDKPMEAEFLGQLAESSFGQKEFTEGIKLYKEAIDKDGQSNLLKNNFARQLASHKKEMDLAQSLAKQACETSPNQGLFHDTYGWVFFQKGEYQKAKDLFEKADGLLEGDPLINEHLGDVEFYLGNMPEATEFWKKAKLLGSTNKILDKKIAETKYYDPEN